MRSWICSLPLVVALCLAGVTSAWADLFTFSVSGPNISGSGTLTGTPAGMHFDATGATGALTIYGQRIDITHAAGDFNLVAFQLQLYNDNTESVFFRGTNSGGFFESSVMQVGFFDSFDIQEAPPSGGAPLPEPGLPTNVLLAGAVAGLVLLRRARRV